MQQLKTWTCTPCPPSSPGLGDSVVPRGEGNPHLACVCCFSPPTGVTAPRRAEVSHSSQCGQAAGQLYAAGKENVIASLKLCIRWKPPPGVKMERRPSQMRAGKPSRQQPARLFDSYTSHKPSQIKSAVTTLWNSLLSFPSLKTASCLSDPDVQES